MEVRRISVVELPLLLPLAFPSWSSRSTRCGGMLAPRARLLDAELREWPLENPRPRELAKRGW
jgi:hypothetical protein